MDGNALIDIIMTSSPIIQSSISAVVGAIITTLFLKKNTEKAEFIKIKAKLFNDVANSLLEQGKMTYYEYYKCNNFLKIAKIADELAEERETCDNSDFDFDWFIRFFDAASSISNEEMQRLWAEILKGEIKQRGKFSLRAIETMRNMSQHEAEIFMEVSTIVLDNARIFSLMDDIGQELNENYGFNNDVLRLLEECGILNGLKMVNQIELAPNEVSGFELAGQLLIFRNITNEKLILNYSCYQLTNVGVELFPVVYKPRTCNNYLIDLGKEIQKKYRSLQVSIHPVLDVEDENDTVIYDEKINLLINT